MLNAMELLGMSDSDMQAAAILVIGVPVFILMIVVWCKIWSKAGYGWGMGLLMLLPIVNLIMILVLGFGDWPVLREVRQLRAQGPGGFPVGYPQQGYAQQRNPQQGYSPQQGYPQQQGYAQQGYPPPPPAPPHTPNQPPRA